MNMPMEINHFHGHVGYTPMNLMLIELPLSLLYHILSADERFTVPKLSCNYFSFCASCLTPISAGNCGQYNRHSSGWQVHKVPHAVKIKDKYIYSFI